jgi:hypothetical protein
MTSVMDTLKQYKYYIIGGIATVILILIGVVLYLKYFRGSPSSGNNNNKPPPNTEPPGNVTNIQWAYQASDSSSQGVENFIIYEKENACGEEDE